MDSEPLPLGLIAFLTFGLSVIAAVMAIDMYKLLRTGDFGKTWRLLIIASVMFALLQVVKMAAVLEFDTRHLSEVVELCFVMALAYAFYQQRLVFTRQSKMGSEEHDEEPVDMDEPEYDLSNESHDDPEDEDLSRATQWPVTSSLRTERPSAHQ